MEISVSNWVGEGVVEWVAAYQQFLFLPTHKICLASSGQNTNSFWNNIWINSSPQPLQYRLHKIYRTNIWQKKNLKDFLWLYSAYWLIFLLAFTAVFNIIAYISHRSRDLFILSWSFFLPLFRTIFIKATGCFPTLQSFSGDRGVKPVAISLLL